jgi:hypothetical protein
MLGEMKKKDGVSMKKALFGITNILYSKLLEQQNQIQHALVDINECLISQARFHSNHHSTSS